MKMKNTNVGLTILLMSAIIYGSALISASVYSQVLVMEGIGWDTRYGIFGTALKQVGIIPIMISILLGIVGVYFTVVSIRKG